MNRYNQMIIAAGSDGSDWVSRKKSNPKWYIRLGLATYATPSIEITIPAS